MKKVFKKCMSYLKFMAVPALLWPVLVGPAIVGIMLTFSDCKKDTVTVTETQTVTKTVTVTDTVKGHTISGLATYKDNTGATANAKGAVVYLYAGSSATGTPALTVFADASGNFKFPYLIKGAYYITSKYNTTNKNYKTIEGVDFATNPGYAVTMDAVDVTQNITLENIAALGTIKIAMDTITGTGAGFKKVTLEGHSKITFQGSHNQTNPTQQNLMGGFNVFKFSSFVFDEANPANSAFKGYVTLSSVNTFEPARDAVNGCVPQTLGLDTAKTSSTTAVMVAPEADTAWFEAAPGKIVKYGNGYIAHGTLTAFYKHKGDEAIPAPRVTPLKPDTAGGYNGPWDTKISKQIDMYFEYQSKVKQVKGANYNWMMTFEGEFTFNKLKDFYVVSTSVSDEIKVSAHVTMQGTTNIDY